MNVLDFGRPLGETTLKIYRTRWVGEAIFFTSGLQCISSVLADLWAKASYKFVGPSSQRFSNLPDNKPKLSVFSPKAKKNTKSAILENLFESPGLHMPSHMPHMAPHMQGQPEQPDFGTRSLSRIHLK